MSNSEHATHVATCERHGDYIRVHLFGERYSGCATCTQENAEFWQQEQAKVDRQLRIEKLLQQSGIEGRYLRTTLENFVASSAPQRKVLAACQAYVERFPTDPHNLFLMGPVGTGKTHLAHGIARGVIERHLKSVRVTTARGIVRRLRATWARGAAETEEQVIDDLGHVSLLVLDEAGVGFGTEGEQTQLFDVLDLRYQLELPVVAMSNLQPDQVRAALGDRLYDRLRDGAQSLACNWPSHRVPKA